jgi:hypothetical protein
MKCKLEENEASRISLRDVALLRRIHLNSGNVACCHQQRSTAFARSGKSYCCRREGSLTTPGTSAHLSTAGKVRDDLSLATEKSTLTKLVPFKAKPSFSTKSIRE